MSQSTLISIIVPMFNEAEGLDRLLITLSDLELSPWGDRFEFVLVDDGSDDETWPTVCEWQAREPRATVVRLAANRGSYLATRAGVQASTGDAVIFLPADLQEGLDLVEQVLGVWHQSRPAAVMMVPVEGRPYGQLWEWIAAEVAYAVLIWTDTVYRGVSMRAQVKLLDRVAADHYVSACPTWMPRVPFVLRQGLSHVIVSYKVHRRQQGKSKWTLQKRLRLMADMLDACGSRLLSPVWIAAASILLILFWSAVHVMTGWPTGIAVGLLSGGIACFTLLAVLCVIDRRLRRLSEATFDRVPFIVAEMRLQTAHAGQSSPDSKTLPLGRAGMECQSETTRKLKAGASDDHRDPFRPSEPQWHVQFSEQGSHPDEGQR